MNPAVAAALAGARQRAEPRNAKQASFLALERSLQVRRARYDGMSRIREEALGWPEVPRRVESAAEARAREGARALLALWMHATLVRRRAEATLRAHGLSFPLWWVLYVADELIHETSDAVSQRAVSRQTKLDKATVSYLMGVLAERSLVDRGPEFGGTSYRIWLTEKGKSLLEQSSQAVELAARSGWPTQGSPLAPKI